MLKILSFILFFSPITVFSAPLSQNDISILLPLPKSQSEELPFSPSTLGKFGELLPKSVYSKMPPLDFENPEETYRKLRVVAIRIDSCFPLSPPLVGCQSQIRFVWQPVAGAADGKVYANDSAVHTFYDLTESEFLGVISQLEKLKDSVGPSSSNDILTVNPLLKKQGILSVYAKELFSIILTQVGSSRLRQATFMQLSGAGNVWVFGGFLISGGVVTELPIPRISGFTQTFFNNPMPFSPTYFSNGAISPAPTGKDTFNLLVRNSRDITKADEPEVIEGTMAAIRIENPQRHNVHTMDCVSCHTAQVARIWATRQYPWLALEPRGQQFKFQSKFNLINNSPNQDNTTTVRAFGYKGLDPAISQRTINETAAVLEKLYSEP
ncbi:MAG: hypothetical protein AAGB31_09725 [Bdellovibrio sp.]